MIRFAWMQFRTQALVALIGLAMVAVALAITGPHLLHLYDTTVANCQARNDCAAASAAFLRNDRGVQTLLDVLVGVVPAIVGIFWGPVLVARELETGTFRLAWTQGVTRTRWLAIKLGLVGMATMVVAGLFSLMVTWWSSPVDRANMNVFTTFDQRDVVPVAYAAFAFALGVTLGVLFRRTLPAMATLLVALVAARLSFNRWVLPHLVSPVHTTMALAPGLAGITVGSSGQLSIAANPPNIPNSLVYSASIVDNAGHGPTETFLKSACPNISLPAGAPSGAVGHIGPFANGSVRPAPGSGGPPGFQTCIDNMATKFHLLVTYQPSSHYWSMQWCELGVYLGAALVLAGFCLWWVRGRLS